MSKLLYLTLCSFRICTICLLKPQRGSWGDPLMKSMQGAALISFFSLSLRSSLGGSATLAGATLDASFWTFLVSSGAGLRPAGQLSRSS
uniref:Uncharacterized protein n=1 Tax=Anguilla anguilla TaxID=7936 RepID=A0A0E9PEJ1_ANGAN